MSYLQDRKIKNKHIKKVIVGVAIIFVLIYFNAPIFRGLSKVAHTIFRPVITLGNNVGEGLGSSGAFFKSKRGLNVRNEELLRQVAEYEAGIANYNTLLLENSELKKTLERAGTHDFILGSILSKAHKSAYDTLVIDLGVNDGVTVGDEVFALGDVPIGRVDQVYENTAKVVLYSTPGEKKEVVVGEKNMYLEVIGRGGGNFEMNIPRDMVLTPGTEVVLPGIFPYTLAKVETIISDPRDSFVKALLVSPVNIQELKFVEIKK